MQGKQQPMQLELIYRTANAIVQLDEMQSVTKTI